MIHVLPQADHHRVQGACSPLEQHLAVAAVIERTAAGMIHVDDSARPAAALVRTGHRSYLVGTPGNERFTEGLHRLFLEDIQPQALRAARPGMFVLYYAPGWEGRSRRPCAR